MTSRIVHVKTRIGPALLCLLWMVMVSVTLIESDAYRYTALLLIGFAFLAPNTPDGFFKDPLVGLCLLVGAYALCRFAVDLWVFKEKGASEWLYAFPLLFPGLGLALHKSWDLVAPSLLAFFALALVLLVGSTQWGLILSGERAWPLFHHNPIHGAVGCGFLFVGAFFWIMHQREEETSVAMQNGAKLVGTLVMLLALVNIYGAKSKGVWLALAPTMVSMLVYSLARRRDRAFLFVVVSALMLMAAAVAMVSDNIVSTAGTTSTSLAHIGGQIAAGQPLTDVMGGAITSQATPESLDERLQLWSNAVEVIRHAPYFGSGAGWLTLWQNTHYQGVHYTLMHNGYLEILVRHGFVGLFVYGSILCLFLWRMRKAARSGIISNSAFACSVTMALYFAVTILTNSNNRLALGESFALLFGAVCFAVSWQLRVRRHGRTGEGNAAVLPATAKGVAKP